MSSARVETAARLASRAPRSGTSHKKAWWLENRDYPEVFVEELVQALKVVAVLPGAGTLYARSPIPGVRRVFLRRVALHLYYTFDDDVVLVRALWGARRERGPQLEP